MTAIEQRGGEQHMWADIGVYSPVWRYMMFLSGSLCMCYVFRYTETRAPSQNLVSSRNGFYSLRTQHLDAFEGSTTNLTAGAQNCGVGGQLTRFWDRHTSLKMLTDVKGIVFDKNWSQQRTSTGCNACGRCCCVFVW